jgi:hypothetical protein
MCFGGGMKLTTPEMEPLDPLGGRDPNVIGTTPVYGSASQRSQPRSVMTQTPTLLMRKQ